MNTEEVTESRLTRQHLSRPAGSVLRVIRATGGLQAQELPSARKGVWARSNGLVDADVERARVGERSIVRTWAMRNTLHLIAAEDAGWLRALYLPLVVRWTASRSRQLELDEASYSKMLQSFQRCLEGGRELDRRELFEELKAGGIDASGQRMPYLLSRASFEGLVCEGPTRSGKPTFVLTEEWLPAGLGPAPAPEEAVHRLAQRYLAAYAPATAADFASWSGLPASQVREAFDGIEEPLPVEQAAIPKALLLPAFDTYLLGYKDRSLIVEDRYNKRVNAGGGIVKPVILVDGMVAGTWMLRKGEVELKPFEPLPIEATEALEERIADLRRFLG